MRRGFIRADIDTTFSPDRGRIRVDPVLPTQGALLLVDPTHPVLGMWPSAVPASGSTVPNLAWDQAAEILGSGTEASLACVMDSSGMSGSKGLVERTTRGGLHAVFSQTQNLDAADTTHAALVIPSEISNWFYAGGAAHVMYMSLWGLTTRVRTHMTNQVDELAGLGASSSQYRGLLSGTALGYPSSGNATFVGASSYPQANLPVGPFRKAIASSGCVGPYRTGLATRLAFLVGNLGYLNTYTGGGVLGKTGSRIFYRAYVEDLTVSGRSYAAVDALDQALFTAEVLTAGGRYHGDTYTDPATLP